MNYTTSPISKQSRIIHRTIDTHVGEERHQFDQGVSIPAYLEETYWWAYVHPYAISFFGHEWIVNLILLGNMAKLRDKALDALGSSIHGRTLQIASVYGDFSARLVERIAEGGSLDIIDVVPAQLENLQRKLPSLTPVRLIQSDSVALQSSDESYDQVVIFFLLHEMPEVVREKTLSEALRVLKPDGKLVVVEFHKPSVLNPFRYLYPPMFRLLEPFALDMWNESIEQWLPKDFVPTSITKETMFGDLYQKVVIHK